MFPARDRSFLRIVAAARRAIVPARVPDRSQKENFNLDAALSPASIVIATKEQVSCSLGDESAILNMKNSVYYGLNPLGARIWSLLREPRSVREVCDTIVQEYDVEPERCERDVLDLLEQMKSEGLVEMSGVK
jgi:hypothetical protein